MQKQQAAAEPFLCNEIWWACQRLQSSMSGRTKCPDGQWHEGREGQQDLQQFGQLELIKWLR